MILVSYLFFAIKCDFTTRFPNVYNESISCDEFLPVHYSFSNSLFINIDAPVIIDNCRQNSISFSYCTFLEVECIINSVSFNNFTFDHNCCNNDETESNHSYIKLFEGSCQFTWNTFSKFINPDEPNVNFLSFDSLDIHITNLNLTNNQNFNNSIYINNPGEDLQFNDVTFDGVNAANHIYINGTHNTSRIDRINDNGRKENYFIRLANKCEFIITRAYLKEEMQIDPGDGFIWFVDSNIKGIFKGVGSGTPSPGSIVAESMNIGPRTYFIQHLSVPECPTNNIHLDDPPPNTVGTSMKIKIAFSFIGGALFGVVVFLILYFTIKYSIKCYQKKKDQEHPVFDL